MIKIGWIGCHSEGVEAFQAVIKEHWEISAFVTLSEKFFYKRSAASVEYIAICEKEQIPVVYVDSIKSDAAYEALRSLSLDLLIVLGWSEILPERILDLPAVGTVGAHASLLPRGRGSAPINWALIRGETSWGNTLMWLDQEVDHGEILDQTKFDITPFDTCNTLYEKVAQSNKEMVLRLLNQLKSDEYKVKGRLNSSEEPLLPRRHPADGLLDFHQESRDVYNFIRALTKPYPGAFAWLDQKKYIFWEAVLLPDELLYPCPGKILGLAVSPRKEACGIQIACAKGSILLLQAQIEQRTENHGHTKDTIEIDGFQWAEQELTGKIFNADENHNG